MASNSSNDLIGEQEVILQAFSRALKREAHILTNHPDLLWQQMYNRLQWEWPDVVKLSNTELQERSHLMSRPWIRCNTPFHESQGLMRTIQTQSYEVIACAFSPEGDYIISGDSHGVIQIFQATTGKPANTIKLNKIVTGYHFSPDGKTIKAICQDGSLQALETVSGRQAFTAKVSSDVEASAFSQDGCLLVTYHKDKALLLWNAKTGDYINVFDLVENVQACSFSPDGSLITTTGGLDNQLCVWSAVTREKLFCSDKRYKRSRYTCNFSPDGKLIVTDTALWEAKTGQLVNMLWGHQDVVSSCVFSPDGQLIASTSWDQTVRIWNAETGQLYSTFRGHTGWVMACAFSPDGRQVLSAGNDETLRIWNIPGETLQDEGEDNTGGIMSCGYSPDGKLIATGFGRGKLLLTDGVTGEIQHTVDITSNPITSCVFSPDSRYIACAGVDWVIEVRDTETCEEIITFELDGDTKTLDCDFSPDGKFLVATDPKGFEILVWDFQSREKDILLKFEEHSIVANTCKFSPDGEWIASGDWDSNLLIWNAKTGKVLYKLTGQTGSVNCCSFSPDGKRLVSGNENGSVRIWGMDDGDLLQLIESHVNFVSGCAFSPDGSIMASIGEDTFLKVYEAKSFDLLAQIPFSGQLLSLGMHPFLPKLICGDDQGTLYKVDLVGIAYEPILVTSTYNHGNLFILCPACQKEHKVDKAQLGKVLACDTPTCNLRLKINPFFLGSPPVCERDIETSEDIDWLRDQVRLYQENNDLENVLKATDRILGLQKNDPFANHTRITLLLQLGRYDEALASCDHCLQQGIIDRDHPGKTDLLMGIALAANEKLGSQRHQAALDYLTKSLNLEETSQAWLQLGMAQANLGKPEIAMASYKKAKILQSASEKDQIDLAIGFTYLQMGNNTMAELEFRNTVADGNQDPLACFGLGLALVMTGKADQSLQWFKSFLSQAKPEHQSYVAQTKLIMNKLGDSIN